jgi:hypothetical protein
MSRSVPAKTTQENIETDGRESPHQPRSVLAWLRDGPRVASAGVEGRDLVAPLSRAAASTVEAIRTFREAPGPHILGGWWATNPSWQCTCAKVTHVLE